MVRTWKIKGRGKYNKKTVISSKYFIEHNCVAAGWGLQSLEDRDLIKDLETYKKKWIECYSKDSKWGNQGVHRLFDLVKKGDYLWTRLDGVYYVAQVKRNPKELFYFDSSDEALKYDCSAQLTDIIWKKIGNEDSVPGSISSFTGNRNAIYRVDKHDDEHNGYSLTSLFSKKSMGFEIEKFKNRNSILGFIGPSGLEDVIAMWLYDMFNYIVIPSTNKKSTQTYEFVLVDGTKKEGNYINKKKIYLQTKNGNKNLYIKNYLEILNESDEMWLVTTRGKIFNEKDVEELEKIIVYTKKNETLSKKGYDLQKIIDFIFDSSKEAIHPKSIITWKTFFE